MPSLYFAEAVPYALVNSLSLAIYAKLGISNEVFAFWTGLLYLPWVIKMLWSPAVDNYSTKRAWLLTTQALLAAVFVLIGLSFKLDNFFFISLLLFAAAAFLSATYDIATDGYYMLALDETKQNLYVGIRTAFYRVGMLAAGGALMMLAGFLENKTGSISTAWTISLCAAGGLFFVLFIFHIFTLPRPERAARKKDAFDFGGFKDAFKAYFTQKNIIIILAFALLYRLGEASLEKMVTPFLLGAAQTGGLGVSLTDVGFIKGTVAMVALMAGNILGGLALAKWGLRKCLWPFAILLNVPNIVYVLLAFFKPNIYWIGAALTFEQFGYGLGWMAFTVFIMKICKGKYKTSHYAISTGIMALGMMAPGMLSGYLQGRLGYANFFILACILSVPCFFVIPAILRLLKSIEEN